MMKIMDMKNEDEDVNNKRKRIDSETILDSKIKRYYKNYIKIKIYNSIIENFIGYW